MQKSTTGGVINIFLGWNTILAGQLLCLFLDESTKKHRGSLRSFQGALQLYVHKSAKTANHFFLFETIWQRRTSLWSIGKCEKWVIISFRFNQSFRNENDASVFRNKILDVTFPQRFKFSQKASLRFLQTNCFLALWAGSEEQQSLKMLKMASESFIQALLLFLSLFFFQNFLLGAPVSSSLKKQVHERVKSIVLLAETFSCYVRAIFWVLSNVYFVFCEIQVV